MPVTQDATSLWFVPASASEMTTLMSGLSTVGAVNSIWRMLDAATQQTDVVGSINLSATASMAQPVPGWTKVGMSQLDTAGDSATNTASASLPDLNTTSMTLVMIHVLNGSAPAALRSLANIGPGGSHANNFELTLSTTHKIGITDGTNTATAATDKGTGSIVNIIRYNKTAGTINAFADGEKLTIPFSTPAAASKGIWLGDVYNAAPQSFQVYAAAWFGTAAEWSDADVASVISRIKTGNASQIGVNVNPSSGTLASGGTQQLAAFAAYSDSSNIDVTGTAAWVSSNPAAITVSATGLLTAVGTGFSTITATSGGFVGSASWNIQAAALPLKATHSIVSYQAPVAKSSNIISQVSVGISSLTSTSPPNANQLLQGSGINGIPTGINPATTDVSFLAGGTLTALQAGGGAFKWVVAIEGYPYLLTDADTAKAVIAWSGTDYTKALPGLFVELNNEQRIDPHDPFANVGGTCVLKVQPDPTDQFGIDVHRRAQGAEAKLLGTINRVGFSRTTWTKVGAQELTFPWLTVDHGLGFVAGDAWIGAECLSLDGPAESKLSYSARGKYSPFAAAGTGAPRFSQHHRVASDANGVWLNPLLTQQPRTWIGRMVNVHMHTVKADGTLNSKSDALCVFAGRIANIADDPGTGFTFIDLDHILASIKATTIGRDMWSARVVTGTYLNAGRTFLAADAVSGSAQKAANALTVVASGASGSNQLNEGYYDLEDICAALNTWLNAEAVAGRLNGGYKWTSPTDYNGSLRTTCEWNIPGAANAGCSWTIAMPAEIGLTLGFQNSGDASFVAGAMMLHSSAALTGTNQVEVSQGTPYRSGLTQQLGLGAGTVGTYFRMVIDQEIGTIVDQYAFLPASSKPSTSLGLPWGLFALGDKWVVLAALDITASQTTLTYVVPLNMALPGIQAIDTLGGVTVGQLANKVDGGSLTIRQLFLLDGSFATLIKSMFYSTGTAGYNHPTYDQLGFGLGLGIPGELLGAAFEKSIDRLPFAQNPIVIAIDKPIAFGDLMGSDFSLRRAFPIWRSGGLAIGQWTAPQSETAVLALSESNKAEPATNQANHRSSTVETTQWVKNQVKISYNRDLTQTGQEIFQKNLTLEDQRSVDDTGSTSQGEIGARNTWTQAAATGAGVESLAPGYLAMMPLFSQPIRMSTRSVDVRSFEGFAPGDCAIVSDAFMRDPATGVRGVSARAGILTRIHYNPGGPQAGAAPGTAPIDMSGEADLVFTDLHRVGVYAPSGEIDQTYNSLGFLAGYKASTYEITLKQHAHSEVADIIDASRFRKGDSVLISQIDPSAATGQSWTRHLTVAPVGNVLTLDAPLQGFDTTGIVPYQITYDRFSQCTGLQVVGTFQAAAATGRIERNGYAYEWTATPELVDTVLNPAYDLAELLPNVAYGDGKALDAGYERSLIRSINAMVDYKAARCSPSMSFATDGANRVAPNSNTFALRLLSRIYLGTEALSNSVLRYLYVQPWMRTNSTTPVNSSFVRVTISRSMPTAAPGAGFGLNTSINFTDVFDQQTWPVDTSSTKWAAGGWRLLTANVKDANGFVWLSIETSGQAECTGLAQCQEGPRVTT